MVVMNATSLYVSTCRLILQAKVDDTSSWLDLYKLFPCLRQSLSCTVCGHLLIEPYTPTETNCQHHVCRSCKGGRKKLKPSCSWCKDYGKYVENVQLRTLLQCYKKLCQYVTSSEIYRTLNPPSTDNTRSLVEIIKEGAGFKDDFNAPNDLFMVPCSYTSASTQTGQDGGGGESLAGSRVNGGGGEALAGSRVNGGGASPVYSVYAAGGNRLTIKRTPTDSEDGDRVENGLSKRPNKVRKRTIGATVTSCQCGQHVTTARSICRGYRCPCYSVDRPCIDCSCCNCNNPIGVNVVRTANDNTREDKEGLGASLEEGRRDEGLP